MKQKDRLAAVSPKSGQMLRLGGSILNSGDVRANFSEIFSSNVATHGLMGSWLKK